MILGVSLFSSKAYPSFGQSVLCLYSCEVMFSLLHTFVWWLFPESKKSSYQCMNWDSPHDDSGYSSVVPASESDMHLPTKHCSFCNIGIILPKILNLKLGHCSKKMFALICSNNRRLLPSDLLCGAKEAQYYITRAYLRKFHMSRAVRIKSGGFKLLPKSGLCSQMPNRNTETGFGAE